MGKAGSVPEHGDKSPSAGNGGLLWGVKLSISFYSRGVLVSTHSRTLVEPLAMRFGAFHLICVPVLFSVIITVVMKIYKALTVCQVFF